MKSYTNSIMLNDVAEKVFSQLLNSSHKNIYNEKSNLWTIFSHFIFCIASVVKTVVISNLNREIDISGYQIYYLAASEKTRTEEANLSSVLSGKYYFIYDSLGKPRKDCQLEVQALFSRLSIKDLKICLRESLLAFRRIHNRSKAPKAITFLKLLSITLVGSALNENLKHGAPFSIINFFSGSYLGTLLNYLGLANEIPVYSYTWGSNVKAKEQQSSVIGTLLFKSDADIKTYENRIKVDNLRHYTIGNLGVGQYISASKNTHYDVMIIDTCYSGSFNFEEKYRLYAIILENLLLKNGWISIVLIKLHPATNDGNKLYRRLNKTFGAKIRFRLVSKGSVEEYAKHSKCTININSTCIYMLQNSDLYVLNLFPYFLGCYRPELDQSDCIQFSNTNKIDIAELSEITRVFIDLKPSNDLPVNELESGESAAIRMMKVIGISNANKKYQDNSYAKKSDSEESESFPTETKQ